MKKEALFCDGTEAYVSPPEPEAGDELQLWFRTAAHDVDEVYLENRELCIPMNKVISNKAFDFYEVKYKLEDKLPAAACSSAKFWLDDFRMDMIKFEVKRKW